MGSLGPDSHHLSGPSGRKRRWESNPLEAALQAAAVPPGSSAESVSTLARDQTWAGHRRAAVVASHGRVQDPPHSEDVSFSAPPTNRTPSCRFVVCRAIPYTCRATEPAACGPLSSLAATIRLADLQHSVAQAQADPGVEPSARVHPVDRRGIEPRLPGCKPSVFPLDQRPASSRGPSGSRTRSSSLPRRCAAGTPTDHRVIPDGLEPSSSWLSPRRRNRWTTGSQVTEVGVEPPRSVGTTGLC